jgi:uncharacterized integral membrane protein
MTMPGPPSESDNEIDGSTQVLEPAAEAATPAAEADATRSGAHPSDTPPFTHTRASGYWAAVVIGLLVLLVLLVFILENGQSARVSFFGAHGHLPEGVALLLAAVIGGLFVVLAGAARILQLRSRARGQKTRRGVRAHR